MQIFEKILIFKVSVIFYEYARPNSAIFPNWTYKNIPDLNLFMNFVEQYYHSSSSIQHSYISKVNMVNYDVDALLVYILISLWVK